MEKQKIIEGNNLIAEFLKLEKEEFIGYDVSVFMHSKSCKVLTEDLCFHRDWCWLMPVVEKIEKLEFINVIMSKTYLGEFSIEISKYTPTYKMQQINKVVFIKEKTFTKIESVYMAVIEFIKWYNQQKNTKVICNMCQGLSACSCEDTNPALP